MKKIDFTKQGGLATYQDTLDILQNTPAAALSAIARALGHLVILEGCVDQGASITDGRICFNGEVLPFVGGPKAPKLYVEDVPDTEIFEDGSIQSVYSTRRVRMGLMGVFNTSSMKRLKTDLLTVNDSDVLASARAVRTLRNHLLSMLDFESAIILKGCEVDNINIGASTFTIAEGTVMINNNIVTTQAYAGAFPVYLQANGTFTAVQPVDTHIAFNPYTSQRYADVLKRATTSVGEVKMFKTLSDRFDNAGIGRWEMQGFKICDDLQSRVPVGYDRRQVDPNDNVWDVINTQPGNDGGKNKHQLTIAEMPKHGHTISTTNSGTSLNNDADPVRGSIPGTPNTRGGSGANKSIGETGGDQPHDIRQPFRIMVYAERI